MLAGIARCGRCGAGLIQNTGKGGQYRYYCCSRRQESAEPGVTPAKIEQMAFALRGHLQDGSPELRQAYARLVLNEVTVTPEEIRISGSKAVLAKSAATGPENTTPAVLSFVREWRARNDSNVRPSDS